MEAFNSNVHQRKNPPRNAKRQSTKESGYLNIQTTADYESAGPRPDFDEVEHSFSNSSSENDKNTEKGKGKEEAQQKHVKDKLKLKKEENRELQILLEEMNTKMDEEKARLQTLLQEANKKMDEEKARHETLLKEANKKMDEEKTRLETLLKEANKKMNFIFWIASVPVLVLLCMALHFTFKGQEINHHEIRMMLVGKTGAGKSASGNTILGEEAFRVEASPASVTASCIKKNKILDGRNITIIDTPGVMDTWLISNQTANHPHECISMSSPDPHVFLLVIRLGRFTVEERNAVKWIQDNFGEDALKFTMILFTGGDLLEGKRVENFISNSYDLQDLVDTCEGRYHVFNNYEQSNRTQVTELFEKINVILHKNMGYFYTKKVHEKVQRSTREEEERKRVILQQEIKKIEEKKRAMMENLIREEEDLKRKQIEKEMKVEERRKMNELASKLRDEQYENKNLQAELKYQYSTSFSLKILIGLLTLVIGFIFINKK